MLSVAEESWCPCSSWRSLGVHAPHLGACVNASYKEGDDCTAGTVVLSLMPWCYLRHPLVARGIAFKVCGQSILISSFDLHPHMPMSKSRQAINIADDNEWVLLLATVQARFRFSLYE
jgi:hypothetical protein